MRGYRDRGERTRSGSPAPTGVVIARVREGGYRIQVWPGMTPGEPYNFTFGWRAFYLAPLAGVALAG